MFHDAVVRAIDPLNRWNLSVEKPITLRHNYRSKGHICRTGNMILLCRFVLLGIKDIDPQEPWKDDGVEPVSFVLGNNLSEKEFLDYARDTMIIVPCEEGEEFEFVMRDPLLSQMFEGLARNEPPKNVLSAAATKGCQFDRVIVYRFGDFDGYPPINWDQPADEQPLQVDYFMNKLYVAVTRAITRLDIVDISNGWGQFWSQSCDVDAWLQRIENPERCRYWRERVLAPKLADPAVPAELQERNPLQNAKVLHRRGLDLQNSDNLRRAAQFYTQLGETRDAALCKAWALYYDREYSVAGNAFQSLKEYTQAKICYWEGECWSELLRWFNETKKPKNHEFEIAIFMNADYRGGVLHLTFTETRT